MIVRISRSLVVSLQGPDNFGAFSLVSEVLAQEALDQALAAANAGRVEGGYAWISGDWLRQQSFATPDWEASLQKMLTFARSKGWTDAIGRVRAHIETA